MFSSSRRPVVFPQAEHARLAGHIAQLWGNADFETPPLPDHAFSVGVALHDLGFGPFDAHDLLSMSEATRRSTFEALIAMRIGDSTTEAVAKHHVLRLIRMSDFPDLEIACLAELDRLVDRSPVDGETFRRTDTLTRLCDSVAFEFCLEREAKGAIEVCARFDSGDLRRVRYVLDGQGEIRLSPGPLAVPALVGYLHAYSRDGYPERLSPIWTAYRVRPG